MGRIRTFVGQGAAWTVVALLAATTPAVAAERLDGRVVRIVDGDTLDVLVSNNRVRVRLVEIDAPEKRQPYGNASRLSLTATCIGRSAVVHATGKDGNGRMLARVICAGTDANAEQVRRGMAWVFDLYSRRDSPLYQLQRQAQTTRRGLWAAVDPVPPWEWRRAKHTH